MTYFIRIQGKTFGPLGLNDMLQLKQRGKLKGFHEVSQNQFEWTSASDHAELFPPVQPPINYANPEPVAVAYAAEPLDQVPEPKKSERPNPGPRQHHRDLYLGSIMMATSIILHFLSFQLQYYSLLNSLPFDIPGQDDRIILVVVSIFTLLIMFSLYIIATVMCIKAGSAIQAKGFAIASAILLALSLVFFLASSLTLSTGKTIEAVRIGIILATLGSITYYASFTVLSFLYHQAFHDLGLHGHGYSCQLLGYGWIGILFIFSMSAFVFSFLMGSTLEPNKIRPIAITSVLESLAVMQILMLWFLFQTFALRFFLRKALQGQG